MTLIFSVGNTFWIEAFTVTRASIANQAERVSTHTLSRSGVLLGACATQDHDIAASAVTGLNLVLRATDDSQLVIGEEITALESVFMNDSGAAAIVGETVLVLMRGRTGGSQP